jgi:hypothetical protein
MDKMIFKQSPIGQIVDADEKAGIVKGYASVFDNIDSDGDIIKKGAYQKTIKENGYRVKYLYQHDMDKPLGKMVHLEEDENGLMFEASIPKTQLGKDVVELIKAGVITENSVGILPIVKSMNQEGYREINEVKLFEVSAVTLAANDAALILDVKGNVDMQKVSKRYDRLASLIRKGGISDELGYAIESEILKLKSIFESSTLPTVEVTEPEVIEKDNTLDIYKHILKTLNSK